ncbi:hypothetical protein EV363DRAFT_1159519 [Boletus edulis]|nr:hypothetical protein EV363DRAFT_1159519 [Boletus edulis]
MPGFLPRCPTSFDEAEVIRAYLDGLPNVIRYADDYIDTAGNWVGMGYDSNPLINWSGIPQNDSHWNMVFENNSEVFMDHGTTSIWGPDEPDAWGDAPTYDEDFDDDGWPLGHWTWENPRPFEPSWPPTLFADVEMDIIPHRNLLLWHASVSWPLAEPLHND